MKNSFKSGPSDAVLTESILYAESVPVVESLYCVEEIQQHFQRDSELLMTILDNPNVSKEVKAETNQALGGIYLCL